MARRLTRRLCLSAFGGLLVTTVGAPGCSNEPPARPVGQRNKGRLDNEFAGFERAKAKGRSPAGRPKR